MVAKVSRKVLRKGYMSISQWSLGFDHRSLGIIVVVTCNLEGGEYLQVISQLLWIWHIWHVNYKNYQELPKDQPFFISQKPTLYVANPKFGVGFFSPPANSPWGGNLLHGVPGSLEEVRGERLALLVNVPGIRDWMNGWWLVGCLKNLVCSVSNLSTSQFVTHLLTICIDFLGHQTSLFCNILPVVWEHQLYNNTGEWWLPEGLWLWTWLQIGIVSPSLDAPCMQYLPTFGINLW